MLNVPRWRTIYNMCAVNKIYDSPFGGLNQRYNRTYSIDLL